MFDQVLSIIYACISSAIQWFTHIVDATGTFPFILINFTFILAMSYFVIPLVASAGRSDKVRRKDDDSD